MYRLTVRSIRSSPEVCEMSHGYPRTVLQEGWHGATPPSSAGPTDFLTAASVLPTPNWVRRQVVSCQPDLGLAAKAAREFSAQTLGGWGLPVLADDAAGVVSGLVSKGIPHGGGGREF